MTTNEKIQAIKKAISLVKQARDMVDEVMKDHEFHTTYIAYNRYGFDDLLSQPNPDDPCSLEDIIYNLESEK